MSDTLPFLLHVYDQEPLFSADATLSDLFRITTQPIDAPLGDIRRIVAVIVETKRFGAVHWKFLQMLHAAEHTPVGIIFSEETYNDYLSQAQMLHQCAVFPLSSLDDLPSITQTMVPMLRRHLDTLRYTDALKLRSHRSGMVDSLNVVAHQWRQPLNLISMEAINLSIQSTLEECVSAESIQKSTQMISEQSQRMAEILKNVLNMGKEHRGKEPFSINTMLHHVHDFFADQLQRERIDYRTDLLQNDVSLYGYSSDLEEVLVNLIANAKDAFKTAPINDAKSICVSVQSDENTVLFEVRDNAGGVPEAIREKIFEPHFSTKGEGEGFGIGLHIARLIITQEFKGSLTLSVSGGESTFTLRIPRSDASQLKFIYS